VVLINFTYVGLKFLQYMYNCTVAEDVFKAKAWHTLERRFIVLVTSLLFVGSIQYNCIDVGYSQRISYSGILIESKEVKMFTREKL
jgi:hypothetical protein